MRVRARQWYRDLREEALQKTKEYYLANKKQINKK